ncbi:hypothetical protein BGZ63DRAFT_365369 [Mariannaea sp. PMI_226]|nr:hypothetical protein BGZ63DRAFT_365369 [Mariannaea sp. PMI_226]
MPADFEKQSYWHERFTSETSFEWLLSSEEFMRILGPVVSQLSPSNAKILHLGFGTSDLQNHLRARGFTNVLNIDYEPLAVPRGQDLELKAFGNVVMRYAVQDVTQLTLAPDDKFDLIIDKSTADAVSCAGHDPLRRMTARIRECLSGPDAVWVSLSYSAWRFDLDDLPLDVQILSKVLTPKLKEGDPDVFYYCYVLRTKRDPIMAHQPSEGETG